MARNVTRLVPDDLPVRVGAIAARRRTTVNALRRRSMERAAGQDARRCEAIDRMLQLSDETRATIAIRGWDRFAGYDRT